jgi:hypothetical protein
MKYKQRCLFATFFLPNSTVNCCSSISAVYCICPTITMQLILEPVGDVFLNIFALILAISCVNYFFWIFLSQINADFFFCAYLRFPSANICVNNFLIFFTRRSTLIFLADLRLIFLCVHLRFQSANICVRCIFSFSTNLSCLRSFIRQSSFKISSIEFHGHIIHILISILGA